MKERELQYANWKSLERRFLSDGMPARKALEFLERYADHRTSVRQRAELKRILRDHRTRPVESEEEIRCRDEIDVLLSYFSLLELGTLVSVLPPHPPDELQGSFLSVLDNPAVQTYYSQHYPLALPQAYRLRLQGLHHLEETLPTASESFSSSDAYVEFLSLAHEFEDDEDVDHLMWFMDDFIIEDDSWEDVQKILVRPKRYAEAICRDPDEATMPDSAVHGFRKLLRFAENLDGFLANLDEFPLFRSAVWHYFSYWFEHVEDKIGPILEEILTNVASVDESERMVSPQFTVRDAVRRQQELMQRMFRSPFAKDYAEAVEAAVDAVAGPEAGHLPGTAEVEFPAEPESPPEPELNAQWEKDDDEEMQGPAMAW